MRRVVAGIVLGCFLVFPQICNAKQIDLARLLEEMLDRRKIAEFPQPEFVCKQASSYNRRSKSPDNPDWFASGDFCQFYGSNEIDGRTEWIMLDVEGPGAVTRWWQTQFRGTGTIRIYLDEASEPIFAGPGDKLVGGDLIIDSPLAAIRGAGRNLYLPIPFRKHCRITFEGPNAGTNFTHDSLFYNINYIEYSKGTEVKTLTKSDLAIHSELIDKVGNELLRPYKNSIEIQRKVNGGKQTLKPNQTMTRKVTGEGAICLLRLRINAKDIAQALRATVITASFDGKQRVWAPFGEFFGSGLGINPYKDWWRMVENDGWMTCWWPMPFRESAEVGVTNYGTIDAVDVEFDDIGIAEWEWTDRTMYFHTAWRGESLMEVDSHEFENMKDWNFITIDGKGVFVGDSLSLYNRPRMNWRIGPWWGEGDEHIFVDGESFPSHFGTGTEDYYGYAFNSTRPFEAPFHAQPIAEGNWDIGHTTNERVRIHDRIPFRTRFQLDMELIPWQTKRKIDYATTTHWYAFDDASGNGQVSPEKVRIKVGRAVVNVDLPFADATAVWHMGEEDSHAGEHVQLTVQGSVKLGVDLGGAERKASLRRGGDGKVAEFGGGYLIAGGDAVEALQLSGDEMTFCIRLRDPAGKWDAPLFARSDPNDAFGKILYPAALNTHVIGYPHSRRIKEGVGIEFLWRTTPLKERVRPDYFNQSSSNLLKWHTDWEAKHTPDRKGDFLNGLLRLNAPTELIDQYKWHDVVIRFKREKLEMFVDGVLFDKEWPHGNLHQFQGPFLIGAGFEAGKLLSGFNGQIDHVAIWDRALTDEEIVWISGGSQEAARRDIEILGTRKRVGQYWRPRGYNTSVGDCMAFAHDGTFHVFFLSDRRHGGSKWGLQALPWGHISTKDFVHWEEHPCPLDITEPWECCLGTGSLAYHDGLYYLFYIKHDRRACFSDNPNYGDAVFVATSKDCIHFKKEFRPLFVPGHFGTNDINPDIYRDETDGSFILSLSNWKVLKSKDLKHWEVRPNITTPQWWVCTSYFRWNDWYYFSSCGFYWMSKKPIEDSTAEWKWAPQQTINDGIRVPKMDKFKGRFISAGFTPSPPETYYGGELLVRELVQEPDGTLGSKWVKEMIPASGSPMKMPFEATIGKASAQEGMIDVSSSDGFAVGTLKGVPQNVRITLRVKPKAGTKHFGLCFRGAGDYTSGCELQFEPGRNRIQFAPVANGRMAQEEGHWMSIAGVSAIDQSFTLDVIVKDDLVDACIDDRRTIITRNRTKLSGDRLFFFVDHGKVTFEEIQVRVLSEE